MLSGRLWESRAFEGFGEAGFLTCSGLHWLIWEVSMHCPLFFFFFFDSESFTTHTALSGRAGWMSAVVLIPSTSCRGTSRPSSSHWELTAQPLWFKIFHTDDCPCGTGPQTSECILQHFSVHDALWCQTWLHRAELEWEAEGLLPEPGEDSGLVLGKQASDLDRMAKTWRRQWTCPGQAGFWFRQNG